MSRRMGLPSLSTETISYWTPPWGGPSARICKGNKASSASVLSRPPGDYLLWPRAGPFTEDNSPHPIPTCYFEPELASGKAEVLLSSNSPASRSGISDGGFFCVCVCVLRNNSEYPNVVIVSCVYIYLQHGVEGVCVSVCLCTLIGV